MTVAIIDYGVGNPKSVKNMLLRIGVDAVITDDHQELSEATKLILPGVGAFDAGMQRLIDTGLVPLMNKLVLDEKKPVLGICLGMHLMTEGSEEGRVAGLGWIKAKACRFAFNPSVDLKVPHMGWNVVKPVKPSVLFDDGENEQRFYFVHGYHVVCHDKEDTLTQTDYHLKITSAFQKKNIVGVQFHPEKSHKFGFELLKRFIESFPDA